MGEGGGREGEGCECEICVPLQEFADALMEVKKAIDDVYHSTTLKQVLGTLLSIGNFLNGTEVRAHPPSSLSSPSTPHLTTTTTCLAVCLVWHHPWLSPS